MGLFSILHIENQCPACKQSYALKIQFKFGEIWQHEYQLGAQIKWGDHRISVGEPHLPQVMVYGIAENDTCLMCGIKHAEEYDIEVKDDIIREVNELKEHSNYMATGGDYFIPVKDGF